MASVRTRRLVRAAVAAAIAAAVAVAAWSAWTPGAQVGDGRHDRGRNGLWMQHGWLGDDSWFAFHRKRHLVDGFRSPELLARTAAELRARHVTDLFPHLCPADPAGAIAPSDAAQVERFLDAFEGFRVMPWVGGVLGRSARIDDPAWRERFSASVGELLARHPRLAGIHLNIEPCPSGNPDFLALLEAVRAAMPPGRLLSVAAYPPPTLLHPFSEVHWDAPYYAEVAARVDQLAVMMYDTALRSPKLYTWLMARWTRQVLEQAGGTAVLLGLPAYDDAGVGYHHPDVENLGTALAGIHAGLDALPALPPAYQGAAVYSDWEMDDAEWAAWTRDFLKR